MPENIIKENIQLKAAQGCAQGEGMKTPLAVLLLFLLFTAANSFADSWVLITPDFTITRTEIIPTKKWVILESFPTILQCNDHRSSLIRQIDRNDVSLVMPKITT